MAIRDHQAQFLEFCGRFDKYHGQSRFDVPFDVAVEERDSRVVDFEADHCVAVAVDQYSVAAQGCVGGVFGVVLWDRERRSVVRTGT